MSPSIVTIDNTPDFDFAVDPAPTMNGGFTTNSKHTLLLAPPSIAAQGTDALPDFDRATTDLQMLDRLSAGLVTLPAETYDLILLLTDADGARHAEATGLLSREVFASLVPSMKSGALLKTQDNKFGAAEAREAVLAGLVEKDGGFEKVEEEEVVVPLRFGKKKNMEQKNGFNGAEQNGNGVAHSSAGSAVDKVTIDVAGNTKVFDMVPPAVKPVAGVGFDFGDDLDDDDDDDLIDEDELMTEEDMNRPVQMRTLFKTLPYHHYTTSYILFTYVCPFANVTQPCSSRVQAPGWKEAPCLQGLHVRSCRAYRGTGSGAPGQGRPGPRHVEAQVGGPQRAGLHGAGKDRQLRQLCAGRCVPVL